MPIYEYTCKNCQTKFEQLVPSMNSSAKVKCPHCASAKVVREMSLFAVGAQETRSAASAGPGPGGCAHCEGRGSCPAAWDGD